MSGPQLGKVHIYGVDLAPQDPRDPSRIYHWLRRFRPIDRVGAWFAFDIDQATFEATVGDDARGRKELAAALVGAGQSEAALRVLDSSNDPDAGSVRRAAELQREGETSGAEYAGLLLSFGRFDLLLQGAATYPPGLVAVAHLHRHEFAAARDLLQATERTRPLDLGEAATLASALRENSEPEAATAVLERYAPPPGTPYHADWLRIMERHRQQTRALRLVERKGQRR